MNSSTWTASSALGSGGAPIGPLLKSQVRRSFRSSCVLRNERSRWLEPMPHVDGAPDDDSLIFVHMHRAVYGLDGNRQAFLAERAPDGL